MHAQKTFSLFISIEKTEKLTKREIEQAEAKVILFFAKFSAKCFQNWPIKNSLRIFFSSTFKSRQADNIKVYFGKVNLESAKSRWLNTGQVLCLYGPQLRLGPLKKKWPIFSYLSQTSLVSKGFIMWRKQDHFLAEDSGSSQAGKITSPCPLGLPLMALAATRGASHVTGSFNTRPFTCVLYRMKFVKLGDKIVIFCY